MPAEHGHKAVVNDVAFSPDDSLLFSVGRDKRVRVESDRAVDDAQPFRGSAVGPKLVRWVSWLSCRAYHKLCSSAFSPLNDIQLCLWDANEGAFLYALDDHPVALQSVAVSPTKVL